MLIYIEKQARHYPQTQKVLEQFTHSQVIFIDNYKNLFDKSYENIVSRKALIIAKLNSAAITEAPDGYGHTKNAYFFKTSLNCIFDCSYCYLKGLFKNDNMVVFVNYEDIKKSIEEKVEYLANQKKEEGDVWFYSGDYSDVLGMDMFSGFLEEFIPFFERFESGVMMEVRTKSANIQPFLDLGFVPKNTEISFSLNPQDLIEKYEQGTASLDDRIEAINTLLDKGFKVGVRFLPLLPVENYEQKYRDFVQYIKENIDMCKIYSSFASGLLYTKKDYNKIFKKYESLDILHMLELEDGEFYRESKKVRNTLYALFKDLDKKCIFCLEN